MSLLSSSKKGNRIYLLPYSMFCHLLSSDKYCYIIALGNNILIIACRKGNIWFGLESSRRLFHYFLLVRNVFCCRLGFRWRQSCLVYLAKKTPFALRYGNSATNLFKTLYKAIPPHTCSHINIILDGLYFIVSAYIPNKLDFNRCEPIYLSIFPSKGSKSLSCLIYYPGFISVKSTTFHNTWRDIDGFIIDLTENMVWE